MKKLMIVASAALCATVGANALESANVVGYTTADVPKGEFGQLAVQFENTSGGNATVDQLFKGTITGVEAQFDANWEVTTESLDAAPQIQVWTGSGYNKYYYFSNAWDQSLNNGQGAETTGWADGIFGAVVTDKIPVGQGFWLKATTSATTVTVNE